MNLLGYALLWAGIALEAGGTIRYEQAYSALVPAARHTGWASAPEAMAAKMRRWPAPDGAASHD